MTTDQASIGPDTPPAYRRDPMELVEKTSLPPSTPVCLPVCRSQDDEERAAGGPPLPIASSLVSDTANADDGHDASTGMGAGVGAHELVDGSALPQNWPGAKKWTIVIVVALMSLMVSMSLVINAPASSAIGKELGNHSSFLLVFYVTVPNLGQAAAAFYVGPLSERYGRVRVSHAFNILFLIFTLAGGFSTSVSMIVILRLLSGAAISSIGLNPSIAGDLFAPHQRGAALSIASLIPILGSAVGPIVGGYLTQYLNWRWTFWLIAITTAALLPIMFVVMKETYVPELRRRALKKSGLAQDGLRGPSKYWKGWNMGTLRALALLVVRPFVILGSSRMAVIMAVYLGILFGYLSLLASTNATVFQDVYGFSETVGTIFGTVWCRFTLDYFLQRGLSRKASTNDALPPPENRLIPSIPGIVMFPIGLFVYGWSLQSHSHWIVPALSTALYGFALSSVTISIQSYIVDIFGDRSASAIAAILPLRYLFGAFLPIAAPYLYEGLGYGWANSLLAFILLAITPIIFLAVVRPQLLGRLIKPRP
ncbi:MFS general substrate transporter [Nemania sp. NC0429]|nr:MFS general substrate transporter [Nemania sp. NC0429]